MSTAPDGWYADEAFWQATYPFMFPDARVAAADVEIGQILSLTGLTSGDVLDLACGPGRHSIALAQRGFRVVGVDRSAFLLDRARARSASSGTDVEWVQSDMRDFVRPESFDLALLLFTSFGFFREHHENQRVLANVAANLRKGHALVIDTIGKETLGRIFNPTSSTESPDGLVVQRRRVVDDWSRMENEWILLQDDSVRRFRFSHWIYSASDFTRMLSDAGFADIRVFADYAGTPYGTEANRLVVVSRT